MIPGKSGFIDSVIKEFSVGLKHKLKDSFINV